MIQKTQASDHLQGQVEKTGKSLQEFALAIKQLVQSTLVRLLVEYIEEEVMQAFIDNLWGF